MKKSAKILIVDDEPAIREMIAFALLREGFVLLEAGDAREAQAQLSSESPDLILLDWMMPGQSGLEFARELKSNSETKDIGVIMLTARDHEIDKVQGLDVGADDYVTKPFSPNELLARVKALLRRTTPQSSTKLIEVDGLNLDPESHRINVGDTFLDLGPTEFRLLHFFMTHVERVYSRSELIDRVWRNNVCVEERTVDVHIRRLRKALEPTDHARLIQTVRGTGYRFSTRA